MKYVVLLALYLGVGLVLHALFVGSNINPASVWSWLWLFGWPAMMALVAAFILILVAAFVAWSEGR